MLLMANMANSSKALQGRLDFQSFDIIIWSDCLLMDLKERKLKEEDAIDCE